LGIPLLDFLIIGENGRYWSNTQGEGQLPTLQRRRRMEVGGFFRQGQFALAGEGRRSCPHLDLHQDPGRHHSVAR
jgi:hypothetical protein